MNSLMSSTMPPWRMEVFPDRRHILEVGGWMRDLSGGSVEEESGQAVTACNRIARIGD